MVQLRRTICIFFPVLPLTREKGPLEVLASSRGHMQTLTQGVGRPTCCHPATLLWLASQQGFPGPRQAAREPLPLRQGSLAAGDLGHPDSMVQGHLLLSHPQHPGQTKVLTDPRVSYLVFLSSALEKEMATHSSILAGKIPWTEEPRRLWSPRVAKSRT